MSVHKANLDAWQVLQTVVDAGGFAQAASQLNRSQSAISYSISKLEKELQLELLTIQGRRAVLTETGQLLLSRARRLLSDYHHLLAFAEHLRRGQSAEINLWVDGIYPIQRLQNALLAFREQSPHTKLNIQHGNRAINLGQADIVISPRRFPDKSHQELDTIEMLAVAHCQHPLVKQKEPIEPSSLKQQVRVAVESEPQSDGEQIWPVTTLQQVKEYIELGLAFGWLPAEMVLDELEAGQLRALSLMHQHDECITIYLQCLLDDFENESVLCLTRLIKSEVQ